MIRPSAWHNTCRLPHTPHLGCCCQVTVNFFSAYVMDTVNPELGDPSNFYGAWGGDHTTRYAQRAAHFAAGSPYSALCAEGSLYMDSFFQVGALQKCQIAAIPAHKWLGCTACTATSLQRGT